MLVRQSGCILNVGSGRRGIRPNRFSKSFIFGRYYRRHYRRRLG
jgi:hypothetical protein